MYMIIVGALAFLTIIYLLGMINPKIIMFWSKKSSRLPITIFYGVMVAIIAISTVVYINNPGILVDLGIQEDSGNNYEEDEEDEEDRDYENHDEGENQEKDDKDNKDEVRDDKEDKINKNDEVESDDTDSDENDKTVDTIVSTPTPIKITNAYTSSYLEPQGSHSYEPVKVNDGSNSTAWVEGVSGQGIGEWIMLEVDGGKLSELSIINGLGPDIDTYYKNSRVKKVDIEFSNGGTYSATFADGLLNAQNITFNDPIDTDYIKITIVEVYEGNKYEDTCISEVVVK